MASQSFQRTSADRQKEYERYYAQQAASKLKESWSLRDHETPDFMVTTPTGIFGLEVVECHIGTKSKRKGSRQRAFERENDRWLKSIREAVETKLSVPLTVQYIGPASQEARDDILASIAEEMLETKERLYSFERRVRGGKLFVTVGVHPVWTFIQNQVGWVSRDGAFLQREIDAKAAKLDAYRVHARDVRLLVLADRIYNSGKLELPEDFRPDLRGFDAVYFFSTPVSVTAFYPG